MWVQKSGGGSTHILHALAVRLFTTRPREDGAQNREKRGGGIRRQNYRTKPVRLSRPLHMRCCVALVMPSTDTKSRNTRLKTKERDERRPTIVAACILTPKNGEINEGEHRKPQRLLAASFTRSKDNKDRATMTFFRKPSRLEALPIKN